MPYGLDVFTNYVYWSTREKQSIMRQDKFSRGVNETLLSRQFSLYDVKYLQKNKAPKGGFNTKV